ncbi:MAG: hypothetical protein ACLGG0_02435 [Bacteriovoracia bacterium]
MTSAVTNLEHKIDELISSLGGLERLRELSRLSSLDHLVNLHLLSHLTKLDKIEGLDKLQLLEKLEELKKLDSLNHLQQLEELKKLNELRQLESLNELKQLDQLQKLDSLKELKNLDRLESLDKLHALHRLDALGSLRDLGGLERLDHLKYLENLDRLQELTALTKLEELSGLKELLEANSEKFNLLKHLDALNNLPLLEKLGQLDKLDQLDELKNLDKLIELRQLDRLTTIHEIPPAAPVPEKEEAVETVVAPVIQMTSSWQHHLTQFGLDLLRTFILAGVLVALMLIPQGRKLANKAAAILGFGQDTQVGWALETIQNFTPQEFPKHWASFQKRMEIEIELIFDRQTPWPLKRRYEVMYNLHSYDYSYEGISLKEQIKKDVMTKLTVFENDWSERLNQEVAQMMLKSSDNQKLTLLNQLKDSMLGGRWEELLKISLVHQDERLAFEASIMAMVHLQWTDPQLIKKHLQH